MVRSVLGVLVLATFTNPTIAACVPDVPERVLNDPQILNHAAIIEAFDEVEKALRKPFDANTTRDGLSFALVHASSSTPVYTFNAGTLKFNETSFYPQDTAENAITGDSIFRANSISKNVAITSALILSRLTNRTITLNTPVRHLLPSFHLLLPDWEDGGRDITLAMLASHTSGITRDSFSTGFNQVLSTGKVTTDSIGALWANQTVDSVVEEVGRTGLMFKPGERAAYSNAGVGILGAAVASYYNEITREDLSWSQLAEQEILEALNMTNSFFGSIPDSLIPSITVPGGENWADLVLGEGYNPVAGMWSSANDLSKYIHNVWLQQPPSLISPFDRRHALKPVYSLPDGKQQVGTGWEIMLHTVPTSSNTSDPDITKTYGIYGKSGSGGGWRSWMDVVPNLGYGLVILSQTAGLAGYETLYPGVMYSDLQDILIPAFAEALSARVKERFVGTYGSGRDTGIITDEVSIHTVNSTTYARLEVQDQVLYMRELVVNGSSALEAIDRVSWVGDVVGDRFFSRPAGVVLEPAGGASEIAEFGDGAQVFRIALAGEETCDWYDYDGYKDQNGWPLTKVVLVETGDGVELHYPPFDIVVTKS
ncbi:uncharacterized protein EKO05_0007064 [Ascochyta rabiei]|uniref:Uncharacterized protein n=1 Tax=Didymella rabiei TaxID=5454 RepID=A0A163G715_DIDRA|nr:uncharacterized protein EKO05_0007064 [Ascochyta rabiei]KZM24715.1 hypothetical protein ST47_g4186 [Ascochyta rabiei]UPX16675.1 hypothetical protein EKO05_0007064 [Ascochyta rabiei]